MIKLVRFALARSIIHFGLRVMPAGRSRREITWMLRQWSLHVMEVTRT